MKEMTNMMINLLALRNLTLERGIRILTLCHYVLMFVTHLSSISTTSDETFEVVFFKSLILASVSSSSFFTLDPELPVV